MPRDYNKDKDGVWGCTDAQSNYIRTAQDNGATMQEVRPIVEAFQRVNEKGNSKQ